MELLQLWRSRRPGINADILEEEKARVRAERLNRFNSPRVRAASAAGQALRENVTIKQLRIREIARYLRQNPRLSRLTITAIVRILRNADEYDIRRLRRDLTDRQLRSYTSLAKKLTGF